uniref:EamA domain-containing protein n=1 Tax=Oryza glumipatula TaxID=40148 RepID=A0A0D9Y511_9ORYZ
MDAKKPYFIAIIIQVIYTGLFVVTKAAFNHGTNTFIFIFYRQAAASLLLLPLAIILERKNAPPMSIRLFAKLFLYALLGNTISFNLYNTGLKYTSSTVASAAASSVPVLTFFFAALLRLEVIRLRRLSGVAKVAGVGLCLGGVLVIALYSGPALSPLNHHRAFGGGAESGSSGAATRARWVTGTLLMLLSNVTWSLWIVLMSPLLNEYPCKMLATALQSLLSAAQSLVLAAAAAARDPAAWRLRLDAGLLAVAYSAVAVTGVSYYLQAWCIQKKGPVFLAIFVFTIFCALFVLGEVVHLGSVVGGVLMVVGLYSVLWGKSKEHDTLTLATAMPTPASVQQQEKKVAAVPAPADSSSRSAFSSRSNVQAMGAKTPYVVIVIVELIYTGMYIISKAAFNQGMNTFIFIFYRQAAASVLLLPLAIVLERRNAPPMSLRLFIKFFLCALFGSTGTLNLYNMGLKYTTSTVASAAGSSIPVMSFFLALLLRQEMIRLRSLPGSAKAAGVGLCLAGVLVIALYTGPTISPLIHHRVFAGGGHEASASGSGRTRWIVGTVLILLSNVTWLLWSMLMAPVLREYPNKLLATTWQCVISAAQSLAVAAAAAARDPAAWRLRLDTGLLAVAYSGVVVTAVAFYLMAWCIEKKGPVFLAMSTPLAFVFTVFCCIFFLGETVHAGSVVGGVLMVAGLYSVLWGKSKEQDKLTLATATPTVAAVEQKEAAAAAPDADASNSGSELHHGRWVSLEQQVIYTGLYIISKAAFNQGMNTFIFSFYRQAAASVLLLPLAIILERRNAPPMSPRLFIKLFLCALLGNTGSLNLYNMGLKYTSSTVASATTSSIPVVTFFLALLLRQEVIRLSSSGVAKAAGVGLSLAGVLVIALYAGPAISPLNHHRAFAGGGGHEASSESGTRTRWIEGTLLMVVANAMWSLWIVLMAFLLNEHPNSKLLATTLQSVISTAQSLALAAAVERDPAAWRLRLDTGLLAVVYSGVAVTGVSCYLQAWCIEKKGPVFLAMGSPLSIVFTIFCSLFLLGEIEHLGSIVGGILMVAGLYSVLWGKNKEHKTLTLTTATATATATVAAVQQQEAAAAPAPDADSGNELQQRRLASPEQQV